MSINLSAVTMCVHCYKLAADEARHRILSLLKGGELSVSEITSKLHVSQPTVSHHLRVLTDAGLLTVTANGRRRMYALRAESNCFTECGLLAGLAA